MAGVASLIGVYPARGFVRPEDSVTLLGPSAAPRDAVYLRLDAMISEAPDYEFDPTRSQVEDGSTISDHVTPKPLKLTVQAIITDTSLLFKEPASGPFSNPQRSKKAFDWLEKLAINRTPFDFVGGFKIYKSMVITKFTPINAAETGDALRFHCSMEQVLTVSSQVILNKKAAAKTSQGSQLLGDATPTESNAVVDAAGNDTTARAGSLSDEISPKVSKFSLGGLLDSLRIE